MTDIKLKRRSRANQLSLLHHKTAVLEVNLKAEHDRIEQLNDRLTTLENVRALEAAVTPPEKLYTRAEVDAERKEVRDRMLHALSIAVVPQFRNSIDQRTLQDWIKRCPETP